MVKRPLTLTESFDFRQALHVAILDALVTSRRWQPGDLIFQGGTCLHLAHGSPRQSEDLDFLVNSSLKLDSISEAIQARLEGTNWLPSGAKLTVGNAKDGSNPHAFNVVLSGREIHGSVRVKVELMKADPQALSSIKIMVAPVRLTRGPAAGMQTFVPTEELSEIYSDKVFALGARPYLKPRDVFDLHWLTTQENINECSVKDIQVRLATYPNETPSGWLDKAFERRQELKSSVAFVAGNLKTWLPSSWPLTEPNTQAMVNTAIAALEQGIDVMRELEAEYRDDNEGPSP